MSEPPRTLPTNDPSSDSPIERIVVHDPPPRLLDPWRPHAPVLLDGWFERHRFSPLLMALLATVASFLLFQGVGGVVGITLVIMRVGVAGALDQEALVTDHIDLMIAGNTVGQVLGLGVLTLLLARLHSSTPWAFIRLRSFDVRLFGLALLGMALLIPIVQVLGKLNAFLPLPEFLEVLEAQQNEMLESLLGGALPLWVNLLALALTPAICEELFFRGYLQRQVERGSGVRASILMTGIVFGLYHLRLAQALPLSVLGIYLCYVTWRMGSIVPAMILHLLYNGSAIVATFYVANEPGMEIEAMEQALAPWYVWAPSVLLLVVTLRIFERQARSRLAATAPAHRVVSHKDSIADGQGRNP